MSATINGVTQFLAYKNINFENVKSNTMIDEQP